MIAKNFRIGNYLQDGKGRICKVEKLGTDWNENGIEAPAIKGALTTMPNTPIEITVDWLLNFGFVKKSSEVYYLDTGAFGFEWIVGEGMYFEGVGIDIEYVHELQNLFFAVRLEEIRLKSESSACV